MSLKECVHVLEWIVHGGHDEPPAAKENNLCCVVTCKNLSSAFMANQPRAQIDLKWRLSTCPSVTRYVILDHYFL